MRLEFYAYMVGVRRFTLLSVLLLASIHRRA